MPSKLNALTGAAALALLACASPSQAGELWIDYLEERFPICPLSDDENAVIDERAGEFLRDMIYEIDKVMGLDDNTSLTLDGSGRHNASFTVERQRQIIDRLDGLHYFLVHTMPPFRRSGRIELGQHETTDIAVDRSIAPTGDHASLRAAFGAMLIQTPLDDAAYGPTVGPLLFSFLTAAAQADSLLPPAGMEPTETIASPLLLAALLRIESDYAELGPALTGLVDRLDFGSLLERELWAQCNISAGDERISP